jgi:cytochrome P450
METAIDKAVTQQVPEVDSISDSSLRPVHDLPGPKGLPYVGNALRFKPSRAHLIFEDWARQFGSIYKVKIGPRILVVVSDHRLIASALRDRPDGFSRTVRLEQVWTEMGLPPGVFGANGEMWRRQRRMVMASFDPVHVKHYFPSLQKVADRLGRRWQKAADLGDTIELQSDLMRFTVDAIAGLAFGASVNTLESEEDRIQQHLDKIFPLLFKRIFTPLPWHRWLPSADDLALKRSIPEVMAAVNDFVAQARARMHACPTLREAPENLLEAMIAAADQPDSGMDDVQVAGNVLTMLLAGEDTTANTLAWMLHLLWQNPSALKVATDEVRRVCPRDEPLTLEHLNRLDFVEACAHETMRLKPVAPQLGLEALQETVLGNVRLPKGTVVMALMRVDSVSDDHIPNARAFLPQRWLADAGDEGQPKGASTGNRPASSPKRISMPFGAGPRICPGRYLALLEMKMAMATLLSRFDIAFVGTNDGHEPTELMAFTMTPVGLQMRLTTRP